MVLHFYSSHTHIGSQRMSMTRINLDTYDAVIMNHILVIKATINLSSDLVPSLKA